MRSLCLKLCLVACSQWWHFLAVTIYYSGLGCPREMLSFWACFKAFSISMLRGRIPDAFLTTQYLLIWKSFEQSNILKRSVIWGKWFLTIANMFNFLSLGVFMLIDLNWLFSASAIMKFSLIVAYEFRLFLIVFAMGFVLFDYFHFILF